MVHCLVTGAAGFAGRHLLRELLARGYRLAATYYRTEPPVDMHRNDDDIKWIHCDARSSQQTRHLIETVRPANIVHMAAVGMPTEADRNPRVATETNVNGWLNVLEAVHDLRSPCRVLLISSYCIYGSQAPGEKGFDEKEASQPGDVYTATRVLGEMVARRFMANEGVDALIARVGNHVGPGQAAGYFVSSLGDQIARIERNWIPAVVRVGNIEARRDLTDVRDVVRAYVDLMERGRSGEVYNVCSGRPTSLRLVVETFRSLSRSAFDVRMDPRRIRLHDPPVLFANRSKLTRDTRWRPEIELETTLNDVLNDCRQRLDMMEPPISPTAPEPVGLCSGRPPLV